MSQEAAREQLEALGLDHIDAYLRSGGLEAIGGFDAEEILQITEMLADRERYQAEMALESVEGPLESVIPQLTPDDARAFVSDKSYEMIVRYETGGRAYYERIYKSAPVWPGYSSGVTIGFGFDIGYHSEQQLLDAWGHLLPSQDIERLKEAVGLKGDRAKALARRLKDIRVSWEVSETVFQNNTLPLYVGKTMWALENFDLDQMHAHSTGALVSLVFNRGHNFTSTSDKRSEMVNIRRHMEKPVYPPIPAELRRMKRHWSSAGLKKRRDEEADLFEEGVQIYREQQAALVPLPVRRPIPGAGPEPIPRPDPVVVPGADDASSMTLAAARDPLAGVDLQNLGVEAGDGGLEGPGARAQAYANIEDDWDAIDAMSIEDLEAGPKLEGARRWFAVKDVRWASEDNLIPDYRHVSPPDDPDGIFEFTADDLELLIAANRFEPYKDHGKILFGLRGAQLQGEDAQSGDKLVLRVVRPNHQHFRCTIGVLDCNTRTISGFVASTVPNRAAVYTCWKRHSEGRPLAGNMLATGCHGYIVGPHIASSSHVEGAFLLRRAMNDKRTVVAYRSVNDVTYTTADLFDVCKPGDNIHPAFSASTAEFSSFGCQTVRGRGSGTSYSGEWEQFRLAAGLSPDGRGDNGTPYSYVLLTGLEARVAVEMRQNGQTADEALMLQKLVRLRQGSKGDEVSALQAALGLDQNGDFGPDECAALARWQQDAVGYSDGIYAQEYDAIFKRNILGRSEVTLAAAIDPLAGSMAGPGTTSLEAIGKRRRAPMAQAAPTPSAALETAATQAHIRALVETDESQLVRRLGVVTQMVASNPRAAGNLELVTLTAPAPEGLGDAMSEIGERVYGRLEGELFKVCCGSGGADQKDRQEISRALAKMASPTSESAGRTDLVTAIAAALIGTGLAWYGAALIVAAIFARRIAKATLEETCQVWGTRRRGSLQL